MDILGTLGDFLSLPVKGARAGGQAIIDIFDRDEPRAPRISDEEFDEWARRQAEREQERDLAEFAARQRNEGPNFDNMGRRDPEQYGTGQEGFEEAGADRMSALDKMARSAGRANMISAVDGFTRNQSERANSKRDEERLLVEKLMLMLKAQAALREQFVGKATGGGQGGGGFGSELPTITQSKLGGF